MRFIFVFLILFLFFNVRAQLNIIPEPDNVDVRATISNLYKDFTINLLSEELTFEAEYLQKLLSRKGYNVLIESKPRANAKGQRNVIHLKILDLKKSRERYELRLFGNTFTLHGQTAAGVFMGIQTLDQIMPYYIEGNSISDFIVEDAPRFEWRGLMLDVSRHFFSVNDVKAYIDLMSRYKFNVFHWHLTDDEGWRIEIKSLPKLTKKGAWRVAREGRFGNREAPKQGEKTPYGGYYTHKEIKEIIAFAKQRHITIVPEIDVPGHSMAFLTAYPKMSTKQEPKMVSCGFKFAEWFGDGTFKMLVENTLDPSNEKIYDLLDKVFEEVAELFPGEYIHIGGDECYHGYWEEDEDCKKLMTNKGFKNGHELQSYFIQRVEKIVNSKGKKIIGWDEILNKDLSKNSAIMSWRGFKGGIEAASAGHKVVMSPTTHCYLDYSQGDHTLENPIYADLFLKKSYEFDPVPDGVNSKFILGGQGNLWTEHIPDLKYATYMAYPRAFALSESLWTSPGDKNWSHFTKKVQHHFFIFDREKINICKSLYDPILKLEKNNDKINCVLSCEFPQSELYYTIDGSNPDHKSMKFINPVPLDDIKSQIKVIAIFNKKPLGRILTLSREELVKRLGKK